MNAYVAVTDNDWFELLSSLSDVDEVNFWYPNPWNGRFGVLSDGQPLLFKLRSPHNHIAGGGFFKHYWEIPLSIAWDTFGIKNGAVDYGELRDRMARLRREPMAPRFDPVIGCVLLVEPFFWPRELWIENPPGWHRNIQRGRTYDLREDPDGRRLWEMVVDRMQLALGPSVSEAPPPVPIAGGYGAPVPQTHRLGQGTFRALITDLYGRRCAITRERPPPALEAAHIRPFSEQPVHDVRNRLLLRSDVHRLFDTGYLTVTPEHRVEASPAMREDFNDGKSYLKLHGERIVLPERLDVRPDPEALRWHNEHRFRG